MTKRKVLIRAKRVLPQRRDSANPDGGGGFECNRETTVFLVQAASDSGSVLAHAVTMTIAEKRQAIHSFSADTQQFQECFGGMKEG
jgi:hypothetical protein